MATVIDSLTAVDIAAGVRAGEFSAVEVTRAALSAIDARESEVQAFLQVTPEVALGAAARVDALRAAGEPLPPLAGVPLAIKDNMNMLGTRTTCARMLENYESPYTATCVQRMLDAGCVPLGKANMDEFAFGSSTESSAFHRTNNPWDLERVPGGSSGGSAAAVAAGMATLSLGSDTGGSIRQPAALCGVVGMKPTYGTVSRYGVVAFGSSLDQVGPHMEPCLVTVWWRSDLRLTRSVRSAVRLPTSRSPWMRSCPADAMHTTVRAAMSRPPLPHISRMESWAGAWALSRRSWRPRVLHLR